VYRSTERNPRAAFGVAWSEAFAAGEQSEGGPCRRKNAAHVVASLRPGAAAQRGGGQRAQWPGIGSYAGLALSPVSWIVGERVGRGGKIGRGLGAGGVKIWGEEVKGVQGVFSVVLNLPSYWAMGLFLGRGFFRGGFEGLKG
jgi:hypothetical protein